MAVTNSSDPRYPVDANNRNKPDHTQHAKPQHIVEQTPRHS